MKAVLSALIFIFLFSAQSFAQNDCKKLKANLKKGTLNGVNASADMNKVKAKFPCFTGDTEEGSGFNCGGGVFFLNHDFYFYTHRDYIEIRDDFQGEISDAVMGLNEKQLKEKMGTPAKKEILGSSTFLQFKRKWGVLVFVLNNDNVKKIQFHYKKEIGEIEFCY